MPSQDSPTPSPLERPSLGNRNSSTQSLSSSAKHQHKVHRPHVVGQRSHHGRNPSYGKNLNKIGRLTSTQNLHVEGHRPHHQRKRSGGHPVEQLSPKGQIRRNISQGNLPQTVSQGSLKKNHSTTSMPRTSSAGQLKKLGLAPLTNVKKEQKEDTVGGFQLGDNSSSEEEAEWEDSSQSPQTTRQGSTSSNKHGLGQSVGAEEAERRASLPALKTQHKSAPSLYPRKSTQPPVDRDTTPILQHNPRSTQAPPAMSSVSAFARPPSSATLVQDSMKERNIIPAMTPGTGPSSVEVSRFVNGSIGANGTPMTPEIGSDEDDYDSPSSFLPHYHPQPLPQSTSRQPLRSASGLLSHATNPALPSRTQQRLELQRRETMRSSSVTQEPDAGDISLVLRTRSGSRGGSRAGENDLKAARREYETANSHLDVIKRFRNPVVEALNRLRECGVMSDPSEKGINGLKDRPVSRAGSRRSMPPKSSGTEKDQTSDHGSKRNTIHGQTRPPSQGRVRFQRQGSHDDIGLSRSHGDEDVEGSGFDDVEGSSASAEEALLRRMWESREVYEAT